MYYLTSQDLLYIYGGKHTLVEKDLPKLDQLADKLRTEIMAGTYGASSIGRLPPVTALSAQLHTTRETVKAVLQLLQSEGIIYRHKTAMIVNYPLLKLEGITKNFEAYLRAQGHEVEIKNLMKPSLETMPYEVASLFGQDAGIHVIHRIREQGISGLPLRIAENWYPASLAEQFLGEMQTNERMDVIGAIKRVHGLYIVESEDVVIGRIPNKAEAKQLELARTEPVVEIRRSNFAEDGTPLMWNRIIHRAPQFQFTYRQKINLWG